MKQERAEALTKRAYSDAQKEWNRLEKQPSNWLEFETTLRYLNTLLPRKGRILDVGGGPGRYSIYLAKKGYRMTLLDLSVQHVKFARERAKKEKVIDKFEEFFVGSMLDLSRFPSNAFDSVLCLGGPLSHIANEKNRIRALSEMVRVAKKNALIFVSVMSKFGTLSTPLAFFSKEVRLTKHMMELTLEGEDTMWQNKYYTHYFTLDETRKLFSKIRNVKVLKEVGLEGLSSTWSDKYIRTFQKDKKAWKNWITVHNIMCEIPTVVDTSRHFLIVARKTR
jgi:ubiquinone/menaquinone biosynthesis C-methylase UbiE